MSRGAATATDGIFRTSRKDKRNDCARLTRAEKNWHRGMDNSSGDKRPAGGHGKSGNAPKKTTKRGAKAEGDMTLLMRERDELRAQIARSERRIKSLEDAGKDVAKRLDAAIGAVKDLIAKG